MSGQNPRKLVLEILNHMDEGTYSNITLNKVLKGKDISYLDRRLISTIVYGVIENEMYLDHAIRQFSSVRLKKIHSGTLNVLRMGAYQILFMDRVPDSAAVNEAVKLTKKINFKSSGFVNGVLRKMSNEKGKIKLPDMEKEFEDYASIRFSHPRWIVERWLQELGRDNTLKLLEANNTAPELTVRVNKLKTTKAKAIEELKSLGFKVEESHIVEEALSVKHGSKGITATDAFSEGRIFIQDVGSMLVAKAVGAKAGEKVLDVCSAPGGKTTHMAELMDNKGAIIARDIYPHKLELIRDNAQRLGISIIQPEIRDAVEDVSADHSRYDRVLVDAPCSGFGIIRRKPEIRYNRTEEDVLELAKLQLEILVTAARYVRKGGSLVYSTCSINKEENQAIVQAFVKDHDGYEIEDLNGLLPEDYRTESPWITLYPHIHGTDGFFICRIKRIG